MNVQEYIASGILEDYVLGLLDTDSSKEVERMAEEHPQIRKELDEIESALSQYAMANAVPMPDGLKNSILNKIDDEAGQEPDPQAGSRPPRLGIWILAAIALGLAAWCFSLFKTGEEAKSELNLLQTQLDSCQTERNDAEQQLNRLLQENSRPLLLNDTKDASQPIAKVLYDEQGQKAYLDIISIDPPEAGKQYQAWVLIDGAATRIGLVPNDRIENALTALRFFPDADGFALSMEDLGGKDQPTPEAIVALGSYEN